MRRTFLELMEQELGAANPGPEGVRQNLATYLAQLWQANQEINLFSRRMDQATLVREHLGDCLAALSHFPEQGTLVDLGTGGGLPGIVLALTLPETRVVLCEKSPLKRQFLQSLQALARNVAIEESVDGPFPAQALLTARAFKPLPVLLELTRSHLASGGRYLLYKGRKETVQQELADSQQLLAGRRVEILPLRVPFAGERHLLRLGA
jgi:16S rRNA (guanine527-N7)-methyltransferase